MTIAQPGGLPRRQRSWAPPPGSPRSGRPIRTSRAQLLHVPHRSAEDHADLEHHTHVITNLIDIAEDTGGNDDRPRRSQVGNQVQRGSPRRRVEPGGGLSQIKRWISQKDAAMPKRVRSPVENVRIVVRVRQQSHRSEATRRSGCSARTGNAANRPKRSRYSIGRR